MSLCKMLMTGVAEKASTSDIASLRNEIKNICGRVMETVKEKAQTDGVVREKLVSVEKNLEEVRRKMEYEANKRPTVVVVPPCGIGTPTPL